MKKTIHLFLGSLMIINLVGCGADSEADIVHDVEAQQHEDRSYLYHEVPSNIEQNKLIQQVDSDIKIYAENAGYFLRDTINRLESLAPLFEDDTMSEEELKETRQVVTQIKKRSQQFIEQERPMEFDGFHNVHLSMLIELDALERVVNEMRIPVHSLQVQNARVYYENTVISHKQLEMEYLTLAEEFGLL